MREMLSPLEKKKSVDRGENDQTIPDHHLDLRGVICPYNFVKTKLKLESMKPGEVLAVLLDEGEPINNVTQSVSNEGHHILSQEPWSTAFRVLIQKHMVVEATLE